HGVGGDGDVAAAFEGRVDHPLGTYAQSSVGIVERCDELVAARVVDAALDADGALAHRRNERRRIEFGANAPGHVEPLQAGGGEDQRVEVAGIEPCQARVDVAAQVVHLERGIQVPQDRLAAQAATSHAGARGHLVEVLITIGDEGVARVATLAYRPDVQAV